MKTNEIDQSKIICPKTDPSFWLALHRVINCYIAEAAESHDEETCGTPMRDYNHIFFAWELLNSYVDEALYDVFHPDLV